MATIRMDGDTPIDDLVKRTNPKNPIDESNKDDFIRTLEEMRDKALFDSIPVMKIAIVREGAIFKQANRFAAGYDVKAFNMTIEDGYIKFMLGIKSELPVGWYATVQHRSSNSKFDTILANTRGIVDCDFRGEWQARLKIIQQPGIWNTDNGLLGADYSESVDNPLKLWGEGETALQVTFHKIPDHRVEFVEEEELSETERGEGGHGSTGNGLENQLYQAERETHPS